MDKKVLLEFVFRGNQITLFDDNTFLLLADLGINEGIEETILINKITEKGILKEVTK